MSGHPVSSCIGKRACWEHWGTWELADLSSLNVLISFDRLQNKYGPTNCRFYGYLQSRHFVNLRTNISQRKSGSRSLINYWKLVAAPIQELPLHLDSRVMPQAVGVCREGLWWHTQSLQPFLHPLPLKQNSSPSRDLSSLPPYSPSLTDQKPRLGSSMRDTPGGQ